VFKLQAVKGRNLLIAKHNFAAYAFCRISDISWLNKLSVAFYFFQLFKNNNSFLRIGEVVSELLVLL
jgi:hypothetical protein